MLLMLVCVLAGLGFSTCKNFLYPTEFNHIIERYAQEYELDRNLVMAIVKTESNFVVDAHSGKASGLMQLTEETAVWLASELGIEDMDITDPEQNIQMGCYYFRHLLDYYEGNVDVALAAYNGGMGNVNSWLRNSKYSQDGKNLDYIPFEETSDYVNRVNKEKKIYEKMSQSK